MREGDIYNHRTKGAWKKSRCTLCSSSVTYVSVCERGIIFLRVSRDETTVQTDDATQRTYHPRKRRPTVAFSICLSALSFVLPIVEQRDRRVHRDVSPSSSMTYMSFRGDSVVHAQCYNHRSFRRESSPMAGRGCPFPPFAVVVVAVSLALDIRTMATYAVDDSSLLFQASRGSESAVESTSASRWTLSRAIVQSLAKIISASAWLTDCRWTFYDFASDVTALNKLNKVFIIYY